MVTKKNKKNKKITASEIGSFIYCRRAWWFQRNGEESSNQTQMMKGTKLHEEHGRQVLQASCVQALGLMLLLGAIIISLLWFLNGFLR